MRRDKCQVRCKESSHLPNAQFLWRFTTYERQSLWPRPRSRVSLMDDQAVARTLTRAVATAEAAQMEAKNGDGAGIRAGLAGMWRLRSFAVAPCSWLSAICSAVSP